MNERSGDGGGLPMALPEMPRPSAPIRVKVGLILEQEERGLTVEVLSVYRSQLADGDPVDLEQAFLTSLGRVLEVWAGTKGPASSTMPERLRVPEALREVRPGGRRLRWELDVRDVAEELGWPDVESAELAALR